MTLFTANYISIKSQFLHSSKSTRFPRLRDNIDAGPLSPHFAAIENRKTEDSGKQFHHNLRLPNLHNFLTLTALHRH